MGAMDRREQQTDLLPLLEGATTFDVVLRGYDRHQVHEHVERLEADLRIAVAERDTVAARLTELAGQLAAAHNEIDALHARLGQVTATEPSLDDVKEGGCLHNNGSDTDPDMIPADCVKGNYKVLKRLYGTIDPTPCQNVSGYNTHYTVTYYRNGVMQISSSYVFCMKKL